MCRTLSCFYSAHSPTAGMPALSQHSGAPPFPFMNIDIVSLKAFFEAHLPTCLEMLRQMVGVNSFASNRDGVNQLGKLTAVFFTPLGFTAEHVPSSNPELGNHLVMTRPGRSKKSLALVSHLDTVFPPEE